jgi:alkyl hydroperoxide reductase subunit AhpF
MNIPKRISDDLQVSSMGDGRMQVRVHLSLKKYEFVNVALSVGEVVDLKAFCEEFLSVERQREGREKAKAAGVEYCPTCNGPCTRKNIYDEEDD